MLFFSSAELGEGTHLLTNEYFLPGKPRHSAPRVCFALGHNDESLFVKWHVEEPTVRAVGTRDQDPVYEDSCVEIFVSHAGLNGT